MPQRFQPHYLCTLRKRWGLSQPELGQLLGVSGNAISKYETRRRLPSRDVLLAIEVVFGHPGRAVFPALYADLDDQLGRRALKFDERLRFRSDAASARKKELLSELTHRTGAYLSIHESKSKK